MSRRILLLLPALVLLGACVDDGPPRTYYGGGYDGGYYDSGKYGGTYYDRGGYYDRGDAYRDGRRRGWSDGYYDRRGYYHPPGWNTAPQRGDPNPPGP